MLHRFFCTNIWFIYKRVSSKYELGRELCARGPNLGRHQHNSDCGFTTIEHLGPVLPVDRVSRRAVCESYDDYPRITARSRGR
jgi:hypothetical protein